MSTLRPCPFCGAEHVGIYDGLNYVQCNECGTLGPTAIGDADPAALWNRRAEPTLRPCPHDGAEAHVHRNDYRGTWEVRCSQCPNFTWGATPAEAKKAWNAAVANRSGPL